MAINLKPVDVAVIGLGAAGGVAVLPLARAGLKVAGIEAGTWMDPHSDFHADEIYNNVRAPGDHGRPRPSAKSPRCARRPSQQARPAGSSSHDERRRRHVDSLLGAKLAAEAVGFPDALGRRSGATARAAIPERIHARRLAAHLRRSRAVLRHRRARSRRLRQGRQHSGQVDPAGNIFEGAAAARVSHAAAARHRLHRSHGGRGAASSAGIRFAPPAAINSQPYQRPRGVRLSRLLRSRRLPHQREEFHRGHHHSGGA